MCQGKLSTIDPRLHEDDDEKSEDDSAPFKRHGGFKKSRSRVVALDDKSEIPKTAPKGGYLVLYAIISQLTLTSKSMSFETKASC